jgi:hypothetical protein
LLFLKRSQAPLASFSHAAKAKASRVLAARLIGDCIVFVLPALELWRSSGIRRRGAGKFL